MKHIAQTLEERICGDYRLGRFISSSEAGGSRNTGYVFCTSAGQWFARRRHPGYCDEDRVRFDHQAMLYLARAGVPVQPPLVSEDGNTWWRDGKALWEVYKFVEGRNMRDGSRQDAAFLGTALGKFHRAGNGFNLRYEKMGARGETDPEQLLLNAKRLRDENSLIRPPKAATFFHGRAGQPVPPSYTVRTDGQGCPSLHFVRQRRIRLWRKIPIRELSSALEPYERLIEQAAHDFPSDNYLALPHTLVHGDVQPANVLMGNAGVRAFVDFDWCAWRPRIYDLAFAVLFCCSSHEQPIGKGDIWALTQAPDFNAGTTKSFLDAYEKNAGKLSGEEKKYLGPQMALAWCHARIDGAFKVPGKERKKFLSRPVPEGSFKISEKGGEYEATNKYSSKHVGRDCAPAANN